MKKSVRTKVSPSREEIAVRAYHLWEAYGRPDGRALEHWLEAEAQLRAGHASGKVSPPPTVPVEPVRAPQPRGSRYGLVLKS